MATYTGAASSWSAATAGWVPEAGATYVGALSAAQRTGPDVETGGVRLVALGSGPVQAHAMDLSGRTFASAARTWSVADFAGWLLDFTGLRYAGVGLRVSAVYRQGDKLTVAGYATDLAGVPLRQVQLHFIGQTVQDHFFGAATNLDGIYAAYLDVGDDYSAYAFNPVTGIAFKLDSWTEAAGTTTLAFRQVTKRRIGEGLVIGG